MPSGHANHKGTSDKPNTNTTGQMDIAADKSTDPTEDILPEGATTNTTRIDEFVDYPPAYQRPEESENNRDK